MDLAQELERVIPSGPPLPPPETRAAVGRTALRRRRGLVTLAAAVAVVAVVVPVSVAITPGPTEGRDPAPVSPVTRPGGAEQDTAPGARLRQDPAAAYPWRRGEVATATPLDGLLVRPGAVVLERRDDLYPGKDTESVALRLRFRGLEYWTAVEWDDGGSTAQTGSPRDPFYRDWPDFLVKATSGGGMTSGPVSPPRSRTGSGDEMPEPVDLPGLRWTGDAIAVDQPWEVLEQRADVDLTRSFAAPDDKTGAALVQRPGGPLVLVLYRAATGGEGQLIAVQTDGRGDTLDEQLDWARQRYRDEVGLL